jgi:hypothetical protein
MTVVWIEMILAVFEMTCRHATYTTLKLISIILFLKGRDCFVEKSTLSAKNSGPVVAMTVVWIEMTLAVFEKHGLSNHRIPDSPTLIKGEQLRSI